MKNRTVFIANVYNYTVFKCDRCKRIRQSTDSHTTGYGLSVKGNKFCFDCAAEIDRMVMRNESRITLYLVRDEVTNWPGTLRFKTQVRKGHHNIARTRRDAWFTGPDGRRWHGVSYGDWSDVLHCRKLKAA